MDISRASGSLTPSCFFFCTRASFDRRFYFGTFGSDGEDSANIFAFVTSRAVRRSECGLARSLFEAGVDADDAGMFTIGHAESVFFLHQRHAVHDVERARVDVQQAASRVELHDPLVAITV